MRPIPEKALLQKHCSVLWINLSNLQLSWVAYLLAFSCLCHRQALHTGSCLPVGTTLPLLVLLHLLDCCHTLHMVEGGGSSFLLSLSFFLFTHTYVCALTCIYTHTHVHTHMSTHISAHTYIYTHTHTHARTSMHTNMHTHICTHIYSLLPSLEVCLCV